MFDVSAVQKEIWPEVTGILAYGIGELGMVYVDSYLAEDGVAPGILAQQIFTGASFLGGAFLIGSRKNVDFGKGLMFGSGVGLLLNTMYWLVAKADLAAPAKMSFGALVPRNFAKVTGGRPNAQITQGNYNRAPVVAGRSGVLARGSY